MKEKYPANRMVGICWLGVFSTALVISVNLLLVFHGVFRYGGARIEGGSSLLPQIRGVFYCYPELVVAKGNTSVKSAS